jgi:hypothetical protein
MPTRRDVIRASKQPGLRLVSACAADNRNAIGLFNKGCMPDPLKAHWQRQVLGSSGYLELGMLDDAALVLEEIAPEDKNRKEVLRMRIQIYMAAKKLAGAPRTLCLTVVTSRCMAQTSSLNPGPFTASPTA